MTVFAEKLEAMRDVVYLAAIETLRRSHGDIDRAAAIMRNAIVSAARDMKFGSNADGGQNVNVQSDQTPIAADSSRGEGQSANADSGQTRIALPPRDEFADGEGQLGGADQASDLLPPVREPSLTEAARVLRKAPGSGAGALKPAAYAYRDQIRGESWLRTYKDPTGTRMIARTFGENEAIAQRLIREGGERLTAGAIAAALALEGEKLGRISPDQVIEKTLPPAALDRVARLLAPDKIYATARKVARDFTRSHAALMENANG